MIGPPCWTSRVCPLFQSGNAAPAPAEAHPPRNSSLHSPKIPAPVNPQKCRPRHAQSAIRCGRRNCNTHFFSGPPPGGAFFNRAPSPVSPSPTPAPAVSEFHPPPRGGGDPTPPGRWGGGVRRPAPSPRSPRPPSPPPAVLCVPLRQTLRVLCVETAARLERALDFRLRAGRFPGAKQGRSCDSARSESSPYHGSHPCAFHAHDGARLEIAPPKAVPTVRGNAQGRGRPSGGAAFQPRRRPLARHWPAHDWGMRRPRRVVSPFPRPRPVHVWEVRFPIAPKAPV